MGLSFIGMTGAKRCLLSGLLAVPFLFGAQAAVAAGGRLGAAPREAPERRRDRRERIGFMPHLGDDEPHGPDLMFG